MAKKQKKRSEIAVQDTWDLTKIYATEEEFERALKEAQEEMKGIEKFRGNLTKSAKDLYDYLTWSSNMDRKIYKLYYYAQLHFDADTTDTKAQERKGKVTTVLNEYEALTAFVDPELLKESYDKIKAFYEEEPRLKEYEFNLENTYRYSSHVLSESEEKIIKELSNVFENPEQSYEALTDSDMTYGMILNENKEEVELTDSNYNLFLRSHNREVRKSAFKMLYQEYAKNKNTITSTFKGNVEVLTKLAKIYNYSSSLEASLFQDNVDPSIYHNVVDTVSEHVDTIYRYYDLKKEVLGLEELHLYDIYTPLVSESNSNYPFEKGKEIVLEALKVLGQDYVENLKKAFDERWIDVYNSVGKRGGAYSSGFYDTNPYILLNYENTIHDVLTLGHELGHSMHTYYSCKNNSYQTSSYKIFVAEVASTVNELMIIKQLLKTVKTKEEKLYLLSECMDLFKGTIFRQSMFAEFEMLEHDKHEKGEVLTSESLNRDYYELNKKYFGPNVVVDDEIKYEWERIPHFYYNFYVYKYAIGLASACHIVESILSGKENALENYKKFLTLGGSDYPVNELKVAGVDVTKKDFMESAIRMFDEIIEEFKTIYRS